MWCMHWTEEQQDINNEIENQYVMVNVDTDAVCHKYGYTVSIFAAHAGGLSCKILSHCLKKWLQNAT